MKRKTTLLGTALPGMIPPCALAAGATARDVDARAIGTLEQAADQWLSNGRTYGEQRYSPLRQINAGNVAHIGEAWEADLESPRFGIEATPLLVGGVLFTTSSYGRVFAFDARSGGRLWTFDPRVPPDWLPNGCCKPMNRGVTLWKGKVFVGAYDGRLIALDAATGKKLWEVNTTEGARSYTTSGAPLAANGRIIIGNGGADYATRGYLSAYEADTGKMLWRFFVVPGDPKKEFETPELAMAAKTWSPSHDWSLGGDGNPWNALSYDAENDLLYVGTGNDGKIVFSRNAISAYRDRADGRCRRCHCGRQLGPFADIEVDHLPGHKYENLAKAAVPNDEIAFSQLCTPMNSMGNCSLLEKTFNVSKSDEELATFLSEVHEFTTGELDLDQWALAFGVTDALLRPKSSSLDQIQQARAQ